MDFPRPSIMNPILWGMWVIFNKLNANCLCGRDGGWGCLSCLVSASRCAARLTSKRADYCFESAVSEERTH